METTALRLNFEHEPLSSNHGFIRLISLLPRSHDGTINITLRQYRLEDVHYHFDALSYVWGAQDYNNVVIINGKRKTIRGNLWCALDHFYSLSETQPGDRIWIDALCINQLDNVERSAQVQQMKDIFSHARQVRIWLGDSSQPEQAVEIEAALDIGLKHSEPSGFEQYEEIYQEFEALDQGTILRLAGNEYWSRVWTTQEAILAQDARVIIGNRLVPLRLFHQFAHVLVYRLHPAKHEVPTWSNEFQSRLLRMKNITRSSSESTSELSLIEALSKFNGGECLDPRDRVYGLLGIVSHGRTFPVAYDISTEELFWRVLDSTSEPLPFKNLCVICWQLRLDLSEILAPKFQQRAENLNLLIPAVATSHIILSDTSKDLWKYERQPFSFIPTSRFTILDVHQKHTPVTMPTIPLDGNAIAPHLSAHAEDKPLMFYGHYTNDTRQLTRNLLCISFSHSGYEHREFLRQIRPAVLISHHTGGCILGCFSHRTDDSGPDDELEHRGIMDVRRVSNSLSPQFAENVIRSIDMLKVQRGLKHEILVSMSGLDAVKMFISACVSFGQVDEALSKVHTTQAE